MHVKGGDSRSFKKLRTESTNEEDDNIESRISRGAYQSLDELMIDLDQVRSTLHEDNTKINGTTNSHESTQEQLSVVYEEISKLQSETQVQQPARHMADSSASEEQKPHTLPTNQVLSLRSQTEHGIRHLFSGIPVDSDSADVDGKNLPNGFELTDVLTIDKNDLQGKDVRKFGDVFAAHRNTKTLEMPRASRPLRGNTINFVPPFEHISTPSRNDFKFSNLSTGSWLRYATSENLKAEARDSSTDAIAKTNTLFKSSFSSFAPTTDNSHSIITDFDRSQQWWLKYGRVSRWQNCFKSSDLVDTTIAHDTDDKVSDEDLEDMLANFIPEDDDESEAEKLLDEISDLIEALSSYQSMRSLEIARGPSSASKPSTDEQDMYDMLRSQLQILIGGLPPFAVAKLKGDQLEALNISTQLLFEPPEFVGTAQVDDYTLRRNRAAQVATSAAIRNPAPMQNRTAYGTPASAYNAQARAYNNIPNSGYAARQSAVPMYNQPRPTVGTPAASYGQPQFRANGPTIHTPSVQQFQRPVVNGYGTTPTPMTQTPYLQRPSQPGYQQRAQDSIAYNRMEASQKPAVNGDTPHHQQRQYATPSANHPAPLLSSATQQRSAMDPVKQRPDSTTPQPSSDVKDSVTVAVS